MWILNISAFASASDFIFHNTNFGNSKKKLDSTVNIFCFLYKTFMSKQRIPPFKTIPTPFLDYPTLVNKLEELNPLPL